MDQEKRLLKTLMCTQGSPDNFAVRRLTSALSETGTDGGVRAGLVTTETVRILDSPLKKLLLA